MKQLIIPKWNDYEYIHIFLMKQLILNEATIKSQDQVVYYKLFITN